MSNLAPDEKCGKIWKIMIFSSKNRFLKNVPNWSPDHKLTFTCPQTHQKVFFHRSKWSGDQLESIFKNHFFGRKIMIFQIFPHFSFGARLHVDIWLGIPKKVLFWLKKWFGPFSKLRWSCRNLRSILRVATRYRKCFRTIREVSDDILFFLQKKYLFLALYYMLNHTVSNQFSGYAL